MKPIYEVLLFAIFPVATIGSVPWPLGNARAFHPSGRYHQRKGVGSQWALPRHWENAASDGRYREKDRERVRGLVTL